MKIISIKGGLGNQLFEYAYGRSLELSGQKIAFDTSFFHENRSRTDTARDFKLNNFNIQTKAKFIIKKRPVIDLVGKVKRKLGFKQDDFYQSEKYFIGRADMIRQDLELRNKIGYGAETVLERIRKAEISVSMHIRRGDYVQNTKTNQLYGTCSSEYYEKALAVLPEKLGGGTSKKIQLFIFSDDIEWVKENLHLPYPATFVSNSSIQDYEELILMSKCGHHIIANSSFSWWGAWLNPNPQKIVIAPEKWFNTKPSAYEDVIPSSWIKI